MEINTFHSKEFENKNYLIIGAANGMGKTLAQDLAENKANLFLIDIDPNLKKLSETLNKKTQCKDYMGSLAEYEQVSDELLKMVANEKFDGIVYFIRGKQRYQFADLDEQKWKDDFSLNVESLMHIVHRLWKIKKINNKASILFLSSVCSQFAGGESLSYHMSKSALESMCRYLAVELGGHSIRVNTLQLGFIVKDEHKEKFYSEENQNYRAWAEKVHPLKRVGHNEDVIGPIKFFLSKASAFITGQILCVDGGLTVQEHSTLARNIINDQNGQHGTKI